MRVVDTNQMNRLGSPGDCGCFVDQHAYTEVLKFYRNLGFVVIAKDAQNTLLGTDGGKNRPQARIDSVTPAVSVEAVVSCPDAQIDVQGRNEVRYDLSQAIYAVDVQVCKVQDSEALKAWRQVPNSKPQAAHAGRGG